jgi:hypothetical protein
MKHLDVCARLSFATDELVVVLNPNPERDRGRFHKRSRRDSYWKGSGKIKALAGGAEIFLPFHRVPVSPELDDLPTAGAPRRPVSGRILQLRKIVFVHAVIHIDLGLEIPPALFTPPPIPAMALVEVPCAQGVTVMISMATISRVRKHHVFMFIIANQIPATLCFIA